MAVSISSSVCAIKNPKTQMISSQISTASGSGHQRRTSSDLELGIAMGRACIADLLVLHRDQKLLHACMPRLQHGLHDDALRGFVVC